MAENMPSADEGLFDLDELFRPPKCFNCPVCLTPFHRPIMLWCSHTVCKACMTRLREISETDRKPLECPVCRKAMPRDNMKNLPLNRSLMEAHAEWEREMKKRRQEYILKHLLKCNKHPDEPSNIYCSNCKRTGCLECCRGCANDGHRLHNAADDMEKAAIKINLQYDVWLKLKDVCEHVETIAIRERGLDRSADEYFSLLDKMEYDMNRMIGSKFKKIRANAARRWETYSSKINTARQEGTATLRQLSQFYAQVESRDLESNGEALQELQNEVMTKIKDFCIKNEIESKNLADKSEVYLSVFNKTAEKVGGTLRQFCAHALDMLDTVQTKLDNPNFPEEEREAIELMVNNFLEESTHLDFFDEPLSNQSSPRRQPNDDFDNLPPLQRRLADRLNMLHARLADSMRLTRATIANTVADSAAGPSGMNSRQATPRESRHRSNNAAEAQHVGMPFPNENHPLRPPGQASGRSHNAGNNMEQGRRRDQPARPHSATPVSPQQRESTRMMPPTNGAPPGPHQPHVSPITRAADEFWSNPSRTTWAPSRPMSASYGPRDIRITYTRDGHNNLTPSFSFSPSPSHVNGIRGNVSHQGFQAGSPLGPPSPLQMENFQDNFRSMGNPMNFFQNGRRNNFALPAVLTPTIVTFGGRHGPANPNIPSPTPSTLIRQINDAVDPGISPPLEHQHPPMNFGLHHHPPVSVGPPNLPTIPQSPPEFGPFGPPSGQFPMPVQVASVPTVIGANGDRHILFGGPFVPYNNQGQGEQMVGSGEQDETVSIPEEQH